MSFVTILWLALVATTSVVAVRAIHGRRVGDHPRCRRCGYDLFGAPPTSRACAECGASLDVRRAVVIGERRRRPIIGAIALVAFVGLISLGVPSVGAAAQAVKARVAAALEERRLIAEARGNVPAQRRAAVDALMRLYFRDEGPIDRTRGADAIIAAVADGCLGPRDNYDHEMRCVVGDHDAAVRCVRLMIGRGAVAGEAVPRRMLRAALAHELQVAPRTPRGGPIRYRVRQANARFLADDVFVEARAFTVDGQAVESIAPPTPADASVREDRPFGTRVPLDPARRLGPLAFALRARVTATMALRDGRDILESADVALVGTTEVVEPEALDCPRLDAPIDDDARPHVAIERFANGSGLMWCSPPRRGAVFADVVLRHADGREQRLGDVFLRGYEPRWVRLRDVPAEPYEVIFRPTPWRGRELFEPVATYHEPIAVASSSIRVSDGIGSRGR